MTDQLILKFPKNNVYLKEDFYVSSSNQEAYDFIKEDPKEFVNLTSSSLRYLENT